MHQSERRGRSPVFELGILPFLSPFLYRISNYSSQASAVNNLLTLRDPFIPQLEDHEDSFTSLMRIISHVSIRITSEPAHQIPQKQKHSPSGQGILNPDRVRAVPIVGGVDSVGWYV